VHQTKQGLGRDPEARNISPDQKRGLPNTTAPDNSTTPVAGERYGHWQVLGADALGRRIACRCTCGAVRIVAVAALKSGVNTSCGCQAPTPENRKAFRETQAQQMFLSDFGFWEKI
jgi:hypothetical protein